MGDGSVWMEEVGWKFEDEVFSKNSVGHESARRVMDKLMDTTIDFWKSDGVIMIKKPPPNGE